jgi:hypothetical protein
MYYFPCGHISPKYLFHVGTEVGTEGELGGLCSSVIAPQVSKLFSKGK